MNATKLAKYIADYIAHELNEHGKTVNDVDAAMIQSALDAFEGGAADE